VIKLATECLILAGGKAQRLGGADKGLVKLNKRPLIEYVIDRIPHTNDEPIISTNRNRHLYYAYSQRIISDSISGFQGPLAGIYSALKHINHDYLFVVPCDMPFLPENLFTNLQRAILANNCSISAVKHGSRIEPLLLLIEKTHIESIADYFNSGRRSVIGWIEESRCSYAEYDKNNSYFININSNDDLILAEKLMSDIAADTKSSALTNTKNLLLTPVL